MAITICFLITPLSTLHQPDHSIWTHDTHMEMCTLPQTASNSAYIRHAISSSGHMKDSAVGWYQKGVSKLPCQVVNWLITVISHTCISLNMATQIIVFDLFFYTVTKTKGCGIFSDQKKWKHGLKIWKIASKICPGNNSISTMKRCLLKSQSYCLNIRPASCNYHNRFEKRCLGA